MSDKSASQKVRLIRPRATVNRANGDRIQVVLEMPGVNRDGLDVKIENGELTVTGRREPSHDGRPLLRERVAGDFQMAYTLDETVDPSKVEAVLDKGLLTLTLELKEQVKPRSIPVRAG